MLEILHLKIEIDNTCVDGKIYIAGICEVIDNSASGCTVIRDAQLQSSPYEYNSEIVLDIDNGEPGTLYPIGTNSQPVNNLDDALILLSTYDLDKIHIKGSLTVSGGEDISNITFIADRSVGNTLIISSAITDHTYVQDLTAIITQEGTMRYTTSVLVDVQDFDGGAKNCLLVNGINIVGDGSNYLTDCDTYTTDIDVKVPIYLWLNKVEITFDGNLKWNWKKMFKPREAYWDDMPDGYKISDKEWVLQNIDLCVEILEELEKEL